MNQRFCIAVSVDEISPIPIILEGCEEVAIFPTARDAEDFLEGMVTAGELPEINKAVWSVIDLDTVGLTCCARL